MSFVLALATFSFWAGMFDDCARCEGEKKKALQKAIADVRRIGNACQFVTLGHLYIEMGENGHALATYYQALAREPNNIEALRGVSTIELNQRLLK